MSAARRKRPEWAKTLDRAFQLAEVAATYAEDGAFLTAADRLEEAAKLMREGHAQRLAAFGLAA